MNRGNVMLDLTLSTPTSYTVFPTPLAVGDIVGCIEVVRTLIQTLSHLFSFRVNSKSITVLMPPVRQ